MSTIVVAAHPDDEALAPGGTIVRLTKERKEDVYVLILTDGSSTQYPGDKAKRQQKNEELRLCCEKLGVSDFVHGEFPDMQLESVRHIEITGYIAEHIRKWKPSTVLTHFPDVNRDHERVYESTLIATRPFASSVKKLALFPTLSTTEWELPGKGHRFVANEWVNIESTLNNALERVVQSKVRLKQIRMFVEILL